MSMSKIDCSAMTEDELIAAVGHDGFEIRYIKNPSEAMQLAAVGQIGWAIEWIKDPSEAVKIAAVNKNAWAIKYIPNASEVVQIAAVKQNSYIIQQIKNPSEAVCMAAVIRDGWAIEYIENPSEAVQIAAIKYSPVIILNNVPKPYLDAVMAALLIHHPLYPDTPKEILDRAPEILENHCPGLADVYTIGLSINMSGEELSRTMIEWTESYSISLDKNKGMSL